MGRVLLIGLDGAEPSLVARWMAEGRLPRLAALRDRGTFGPLRSTRPPVTFPAWTTCVTGAHPGRHGIFDFTEVVPGTRRLRFLNGTDRAVPAVWELLSAAGKRVCVLGVPGTYPPEPVNGIFVSGFDSPVTTGVDTSFVHPPAAYADVKAWRFADFQEGDIGPGWHGRALEALLRGVETKGRIARDLLAREPWDFFMVVFGEADTVSHHFWLFHDPESPRHRPGFEHAIRDVYARLDGVVGDLIDAAGEDVTVLVVSDHGFGGAGTGVVHLNNWLAARGHLRFAPGGGNSLAKRAALRLVPARWRGALFRRLRGWAERAESASRFGGIDWAGTRAWSEELNYFPSIRVNLQGRDPDGTVAPADYDAYVDALCAELEAWDAVARAWRRDALYDGPETARAPDIILELALEQGYSHSCLRARGGPAFRRIGPHEVLGGKERGMTGTHRDPGILLASQAVTRAQPGLEDIAPTVLAVTGVAGPPMDGAPLWGGETAAAAAPAVRSAAPRAYSPEEERVLEERLRALGYLE
jgi:predicted AlkP superfamily phosphohydrolase/phosphomutase